MDFFQRVVLLTGGTFAALATAVAAQAEDVTPQAATMAESINAVTAPIETDATHATVEFGDFAIVNVANDLEASAPAAVSADVATAPEPVTNQTLEDYLVDVSAASLENSQALSTAGLFQTPEVAQTAEPTDGQEVAQVTRPLYRGMSPFYVGIGGNIGIINSGESATGDFGFNIISKISLGPRFSVRPMAQFSEDDFNITLPITFNFNPVDVGRFSIYPAVGGGVDFGDDIGFLVNGSIDVPISRDFTLNSQVNWRITDDTGLGVSLGVGYNFPLFFE